MTDLREMCLARRKFAVGFERKLIDDVLLYVERVERDRLVLSDDDVMAVLDARPALAFDWLERKGFGLNGGQQRKQQNIIDGTP